MSFQYSFPYLVVKAPITTALNIARVLATSIYPPSRRIPLLRIIAERRVQLIRDYGAGRTHGCLPAPLALVTPHRHVLQYAESLERRQAFFLGAITHQHMLLHSCLPSGAAAIKPLASCVSVCLCWPVLRRR